MSNDTHQKRKRPITANLVWARDGWHEEAVEHPAYLLNIDEDENEALIEWASNGTVEKIPKSHISMGLAPRIRGLKSPSSSPKGYSSKRNCNMKQKSYSCEDDTEDKPPLEDPVVVSPSHVVYSSMRLKAVPSPVASSQEELYGYATDEHHSHPMNGEESANNAADPKERWPYSWKEPSPRNDFSSSHKGPRESYRKESDEDGSGSKRTKRRKQKSLFVKNYDSSATAPPPWKRHKGDTESRETCMADVDTLIHDERLRSGLKGFSYNEKSKRYYPRIEHRCKRYTLGKYELACDAALAYDEAATLIKGTEGAAKGGLNFANRHDYTNLREIEMKMHGIDIDKEESLAAISSKMKEVARIMQSMVAKTNSLEGHQGTLKNDEPDFGPAPRIAAVNHDQQPTVSEAVAPQTNWSKNSKKMSSQVQMQMGLPWHPSSCQMERSVPKVKVKSRQGMHFRMRPHKLSQIGCSVKTPPV
mmetsp:Transcript_22976/g.49716  ORF Transcript_22976/g.49716 Transcript_22976/m.49716 type:complete len:474 (-) Transcript_22976:1219-2640(-)